MIGSGRDEVPYGLEGLLGAAYLYIGQPERWVEWCRAQLARGRDTHAFTRASLVIALAIAGSGDEAMAAADGLIDAAEATRNPCALSYALFAYGFAFRDADPVRALDALRRGLVIAQDSGNRANESHPGGHVCPDSRPNTATRWPRFDYVTLAIRNYHDSGNTTMIRVPLAILAVLLRPARTLRTGGHHRRFRVQSPHRSGDPRDQHRDHPPARCPRRPDLRIARPQG